MLEESVLHYFEQASSQPSLHFTTPLHLDWWINPFHFVGLVGGAVSSRRGLPLGIAAAGLCALAPELYSTFNNIPSFDPTPLFADIVAYSLATLPQLYFAEFRSGLEEYRQKRCIYDSPSLTSFFQKVDNLSHRLSSLKSSRHHTTLLPSLSLPESFPRHLNKIGYGVLAVAGLYGSYKLSSSLHISEVVAHTAHEGITFLAEHPAISIGATVGALMGYLQKPYRQFAAWSGFAAALGITSLQFLSEPTYTPGHYLTDNALSIPAVFAATVAGKLARNAQRKLFTR